MKTMDKNIVVSYQNQIGVKLDSETRKRIVYTQNIKISNDLWLDYKQYVLELIDDLHWRVALCAMNDYENIKYYHKSAYKIGINHEQLQLLIGFLQFNCIDCNRIKDINTVIQVII